MTDTVTYRGTDAALGDETNAYRLPREDGDLVFPLDVPVSDVPDDVVRELSQAKGHNFETGDPGPARPWPDYDELTAEEIVGRLEADPASVAVNAERVSAYEEANDARKTVLEAASSAVAEPVESEPAPEDEPLPLEPEGVSDEDT